MALPENRPLSEAYLTAYSSSIGATPVAAYVRAPFRGRILKVGCIQSAAVTGTSTIAVAVNGTAVTGASISVTGGSAGTSFEAVPTGANTVNEGDVVSLTPSGATGTASGALSVVFERD